MNWEDYQKDFFLFAYLGITPDEVNEKDRSIKACVDRAYLDMCRTLSIQNKDFGEKYSKILADNLSFNEKVIKTTQRLTEIRNMAYSVFFNNSSDLAKAELEEYLQPKTYSDRTKRQDRIIYYGHAQKWINMALKYMWLIGLIEGEAVEELEAPIDTYVMKAAGKEFGVLFPVDNNTVDNTQIYNWKEYRYDTMPWSKLYKYEYDEIQKRIKEKIDGQPLSVIEWECNAWIKQAKIERDKKTND